MYQFLRKLKSALFACLCVVSFTITLISFHADQLELGQQLVNGPLSNFDPNQAYFHKSKLHYQWGEHKQKSTYANKSERITDDTSAIEGGNRILANGRLPNWSQRNLIKRSSKSRYMAFDQVISQEEFEKLLDVLRVFQSVCETHGLVFMLYGGSLLGAYRHFGLIPWDDDVDVLMKAEQRLEVKAALGNVPGYLLESPNAHQWKFYRNMNSRGAQMSSVSNLTAKTDSNDKWPYVDIFFYAENDTHIWDDNRMYSEVYCFQKSDVFPLMLHPFEGLILPVPKHIKTVLDKSYNVELCVTSVYSHKNERLSNTRQVSLPCRRLFRFYPFVFKSCKKGNKGLQLQLSDIVLYEIMSDQSCL